MTAAVEAAAPAAPEWSYYGEGLKAGRRYALGQLFDWAADQHPDAPAIADGTVSWTFEQLRRRTNEFGHRLRACGVREGDRVLVLSEKRAVMAAVAAGIWKAGAVYVPFDAEAPSKRLADIVTQTQPAAVIGSRRALNAQAGALVDTSAPAVAFEEISDIDTAPLRQVTPPLVAEHEPAYIIFTSGSTGTPKGVVISHASLLDYFYNHNQVLRFGPGSRVFSLAPFHFDVSIEDTLLPLSVGSYVFQFRGVHLGPVLRKALRRERITHLIAVSTLLGLITEDGSDVYEGGFPDLRMLMTGAEVCDPKLIHLWVQRFPQARVINAYGPTETTIVCLTHTIDRSEPENYSSSYPIGRPLPGVDVLLLDDESRVIDLPDVAGELFIGGSQVMLGYLGRAQETEQACPVIHGRRYYRSGDRCQFDSKGRLVFLERMDDMIKIGGQRVHLGEIRQMALSLPDVARAAAGEMRMGGLSAVTMVVVLQSAAEDPAACAIAAQQIRASLATRLPAYMMPRVLALTGETRLSSNGKTDERALLERVRQAVPAGRGDFFISHDFGVVPLSGGSR